MVHGAGVDVRTGFDATVDDVVALHPDRVIVATGSRPVVPPVPGLDAPFTAAEILSGRRRPGPRALILGGGLVGIEMAELLASQKHEVVVIELLAEIARDMEAVTRRMTLERLRKVPVTIHTSTRLTRMDGREAFVAAEGSPDELSIGEFDSVVVAVGHRSHDPLSAGLEEAGLEVTRIGDAARPGQVLDATRAAFGALRGARRWSPDAGAD
jgi:pyruvate/2-oxoglutarate dehydrogenase complex dihydrolipoamide dehydrogenase (E3) component